MCIEMCLQSTAKQLDILPDDDARHCILLSAALFALQVKIALVLRLQHLMKLPSRSWKAFCATWAFLYSSWSVFIMLCVQIFTSRNSSASSGNEGRLQQRLLSAAGTCLVAAAAFGSLVVLVYEFCRCIRLMTARMHKAMDRTGFCRAAEYEALQNRETPPPSAAEQIRRFRDVFWFSAFIFTPEQRAELADALGEAHTPRPQQQPFFRPLRRLKLFLTVIGVGCAVPLADVPLGCALCTACARAVSALSLGPDGAFTLRAVAGALYCGMASILAIALIVAAADRVVLRLDDGTPDDLLVRAWRHIYATPHLREHVESCARREADLLRSAGANVARAAASSCTDLAPQLQREVWRGRITEAEMEAALGPPEREAVRGDVRRREAVAALCPRLEGPPPCAYALPPPPAEYREHAEALFCCAGGPLQRARVQRRWRRDAALLEAAASLRAPLQGVAAYTAVMLLVTLPFLGGGMLLSPLDFELPSRRLGWHDRLQFLLLGRAYPGYTVYPFSTRRDE
ncbi:hypothetical protein JKP88DRAFT_254293 [Tribonema minus]|uniref:Uncharacterized protein n=1 Tax=Tribonema minus TaxID=303371 RepID=A0A836CIP3_9STRA|nr:hypothetical protein JKP88DRAFT_254293 [Tribonema minus]